MSERQLISSGGPWEASVGYSRAVRVGNQVAVSGTIAVGPDGEVVAPGDEAFSTIRPAATLVQVAGLVGDGTIIEIEVDAVLTSR